MKEEWKPIKGYEGLYSVSNLGRVRSEDHTDKRGHVYKGRILNNAIANKKLGYRHVHLSKNGIAKWYSVHRLVAEAFVDNSNNYDIVNHLDNDPNNNAADNLEWTTYAGNMQWAAIQGRMKGENLRKNHELYIQRKRIPVIATDKDGNKTYFSSQKEAAKVLGINSNHIGTACRKDYGYKTVGGYTWEYADEDKQSKAIPTKIGKSKEEVIEELRQRMIGNQYGKGKKCSEASRRATIARQSKPILQFDKEGNFVKEFPSAEEAYRQTGISHTDDVANGKRKTAGEFIWKWRNT